MLIRIVQYLPVLLLGSGLVLGIGSLVVRLTRRDKLTPRARSLVFFWGAIGFWALVIGAFMVLEKLLD